MGKLCVVLVIVLGTGSTDAHWSASQGGSIYVSRYLICNERPQDRVHCAGPIRARAVLLAEIGGKDRQRAYSAALDAAYFHVRDAIPALQRQLALRVEPADLNTHVAIEKNGRRAQAAYALAHLGDASSAQAIQDLVLEYETRGHGTLWQDTLAALATIDPVRASRYAIDFYSRASAFKTSMPGGSSKLGALDYIRRDDARTALPILERLAKQEERGYDHAHCEFMATRVRLDDTLRARVRTMFVGNYSGTWLPLCAESVFKRLGDPVDPDDAAALVRHLGRDDLGMDYGMANLAYQRILDFHAATRTSNAPAVVRAREVIRRGLVERTTWPHVAKPGHRNYSLHWVAFHQAALAASGDATARAKLYAIVDDPKDQGEAWLAALWAIRLELPDAADHVGSLMLRAAQGQSQRHHTGIFEDIRSRVMEAFATRYPDDARWTAMLLDIDDRMVKRPSNAAEHAVYRLSRRAPKGTCGLVIGTAQKAGTEATEHAFLALTVLGDSCRPHLARLADDPIASREARGSALEILGALGDRTLAERIRRAERDQVWRPAVDRAKRWLP